MATLQQKIDYAKQNPNSPDSISFTQGLVNGSFNEQALQEGIDLSGIQGGAQQEAPKQSGVGRREDFTKEDFEASIGAKALGAQQELTRGVAKGIGSTLRGVGQISEGLTEKATGAIFSPISKGLEKITGGRIEALEPSDFDTGESIFDPNTELGQKAIEALKAEGRGEKIGKGFEQIAEFFIPVGAATKIAGAGKVARFFKNVLPQAIRSGSVATAQEGEIGKETGIAVAAEAAAPGVGKVITKVGGKLGGLFKGLGSGLSGENAQVLQQIFDNPKVALGKLSEAKLPGGAEKILRENAKTFISSIKRVQGNASKLFGDAVAKLSDDVVVAVDDIKTAGNKVLDDYNIIVKNGKIDFTDADILEPALQKRAEKWINAVNDLKKTDGKSIWNLAKQIDAKKIKNPSGDPSKLQFNKFMDDLEGSLRESLIKNSDGVLTDANKAYSESKGLINSAQDILGKVKYGSLEEVRKVALKLEQLFSKKGIDPSIIDDLLKEAGVDPTDFRTSEAARQITAREVGGNREGLSIAELIQTVTKNIVTPDVVAQVAARSGIAKEILEPMLKSLTPAMRGLFVKSVTDAGGALVSE